MQPNVQSILEEIMKIRVRIQLMFLAASVVLATCLSGLAQRPAPSSTHSWALRAPMPVDPEITIGKFANGMRYYIRRNKKPEKRAELRLVVKTGSILEEDDQQGMAHVVEHMAFDGTTHFPKKEIISFMESLGMRFGADVNAYTNFDETVYMLTVPTDKPEMMDRALLILEDWAHNVSFDPTEVEKERGVVMEEWRVGRGAGMRRQNKVFSVLLNGPPFSDLFPTLQPQNTQTPHKQHFNQLF